MTGLTASWKKSTRSNGSDSCVEARLLVDAVEIRDTKDRSGPSLAFTSVIWAAFIGDIKAGRYDKE